MRIIPVPGELAGGKVGATQQQQLHPGMPTGVCCPPPCHKPSARFVSCSHFSLENATVFYPEVCEILGQPVVRDLKAIKEPGAQRAVSCTLPAPSACRCT